MKQALLTLVSDKAFDEISVREIAARAGVTFPTFYRHFATKEDLLGEIAREELAQLAALMEPHMDGGDARASAKVICAHVAERRPLWTALLTTSASGVMRDEFVKLTLSMLAERNRINPDLPADMVASFVVSGMIEILAWWLRQPGDQPSENVARYLEILALGPATRRHSPPA